MNQFPFTPRDYQLTGRYDVNSSINKGGHPLLVMPTGTGKTKTSAKKNKSEYNKQYHLKNKERISKRRNERYRENKERESLKAKEYYQKNKIALQEYAKKYREENREKTIQRTIKWRENNPDKIKDYSDRYKKENREAINKNYRRYIKNRMANDDNFRIKHTIRNRFRREIRRKNNKGSWGDLFSLTGFDFSDYSHHFNNTQPDLFKKYKTAQGLHIDHIIPMAIYDFNIDGESSKCWNPRNLRIITANDNQEKKDKLNIDLIYRYDIIDLLPEGILSD